MSQAITRLYSSAEAAANTVKSLKSKKFTDDLITVVDVSDGPKTDYGLPASSLEDITNAIMKGYVLKADAKIYAEGVKRGLALVSVLAPFGSAAKAIRILDAGGPVEAAVNHDEPAVLWDETNPFSSALRLPLLLKGTAVFSAFWSLPVLSRKSWTLSSLLHIPTISSSALTSSTRFGIPLLLKSRPFKSPRSGRRLKAA